MAGGETTKEIARELAVSEQAVERQLTRMCEAFGVPDRAAPVAKAISTGELESGRTDD